MPYQNQVTTDDEDEEDDEQHARARAREAAREGFKLYMGREVPGEIEGVARMGWAAKMSPEIITDAVRLAAENGAKNPVSYIRAIFSKLSVYHVNTLEDYNDYMFYCDAADGKIDWADPKWARGKLDDMLAGTYEPQKLRAPKGAVAADDLPAPGGYSF